MLGRARGAVGVFKMLINRAAVANWVFIGWGVGELLDKYCRGFVSRGIVLQLLGGMPLQ